MAVFWFGGPRAGTGDWNPGQILGGGSVAGLGLRGPQTSQQSAYDMPSGLSAGSGGAGLREDAQRTPWAGGFPGFTGQIGGGGPMAGGRTGAAPAGLTYQFGTGPNSGVNSSGGTTTSGGTGAGTPTQQNPNDPTNYLLDIIRGERARSRENQRGILDAAAGRGLSRSAAAPLRRERQGAADRITGLQHDFLAQRFEDQARQRQAELQAELERQRLAQELQLGQARLGFERESLQSRLAAEAQQAELDRQNRLATASYSGGGGGFAPRLSDVTGRRPGGYQGAPFSQWSGQAPSSNQQGAQAGSSAATSDLGSAFSLDGSSGGGSTSQSGTGSRMIWDASQGRYIYV